MITYVSWYKQGGDFVQVFRFTIFMSIGTLDSSEWHGKPAIEFVIELRKPEHAFKELYLSEKMGIISHNGHLACDNLTYDEIETINHVFKMARDIIKKHKEGERHE